MGITTYHITSLTLLRDYREDSESGCSGRWERGIIQQTFRSTMPVSEQDSA